MGELIGRRSIGISRLMLVVSACQDHSRHSSPLLRRYSAEQVVHQTSHGKESFGPSRTGHVIVGGYIRSSGQGVSAVHQRNRNLRSLVCQGISLVDLDGGICHRGMLRVCIFPNHTRTSR